MSSISPVREARLRAHLTAKALAEKAGVSYDRIYAAERGEQIGDLAKQKIADALGFERLDLFPEDEEVAS